MVREQVKRVGQRLRDQREPLAQDAVDRQYARYPERWSRFGPQGREKSVRDMGYHLDYLIEALEAADPSLFIEYAAWAKVLFANLGFEEDDLASTLDSLRSAVADALPEKIATVPLSYIDAAANHARSIPSALPSLIEPNQPHADLVGSYLQALLAGDRREASQMVTRAVENGMDVRDVYINVFQVSQREVGRLWQTNRISVAQEHYCTAATQLIMSQLYPFIFGSERKGLRFVGTCVGGELHEMGVRMVADFFEMEGWDTYYLGANTPTESILQTLDEQEPDVLGISATMTFHVRRVADLVAAVRASDIGPQVKILVGGYPFLISSDLWREVGADGTASDAQHAIGVASDLVEQSAA